MQGRRKGGEARVLVESRMMLSRGALGSKDLQGSRKVDYLYVLDIISSGWVAGMVRGDYILAAPMQ